MSYKGVYYELKPFNSKDLANKSVCLIGSGKYDYYLCNENNTIYYI